MEKCVGVRTGVALLALGVVALPPAEF
jgi:hypothetical protein